MPRYGGRRTRIAPIATTATFSEPLPESDTTKVALDRQYVFGLDVVRASAVLLVVFSHMIPGVDALGMAGVELFFVLSGYLVGGLFLRAILQPADSPGIILWRFWRRRWARTIPNYALFFMVWLAVKPPIGMSVPEVMAYAVFLQNLIHPIGRFFMISWSLAIEEWFYLVLPGATMGMLLLTRRPFLSIGIVSAAIVAASAIARLQVPIGDMNFGVRMVVAYRLDALALGVLAAMLAYARPVQWRALARAWPGALPLFIASCVVLFAFRFTMTAWQASALFSLLPITGCVLLARAVRLGDRDGMFGTAIRSVSQWSYSMYLSHIPVFMTMYSLPGYAGFPTAEKMAVKVVGLGLTLLVSAAVFTWFERPMLNRLSPRPQA